MVLRNSYYEFIPSEQRKAHKGTGAQTMKTLNDITFGLTVTTAYNGTSGKITAKMKHGDNLVTKASVHYDHALSSNENHFQAAITCLNKVVHEYDKQFEIIAYSYSEKETGYNFICQRQF